MSVLTQAGGSLFGIAGKCRIRHGRAATIARDVNQLKSHTASIESGARSDVAALAAILQNSSVDSARCATLMKQCQDQAAGVMAQLTATVKALEDLQAKCAIAEKEIRAAASVVR